MSTAPERPLSSLGIAVLNEVKSEIAVRNISGKALADLIGVSNNYLAKRLRGDMALSIADVEGISKVLGIDAVTLFARAADAHNARIATYETADAPQRVTPTRPTASAPVHTSRGPQTGPLEPTHTSPTASATTPRVAPAPTVAPLAADGPLMPTPEQLAAIANGFIDYDLVASTPDDTDDTPDEAP